MVRTRVGYAGGQKENPTYRSLGDHTETLEIDYDPEILSYPDLLALFWDSHNPTVKAWSRQYMSIIFFHNQEQEEMARESKSRWERELGVTLYTEIKPLTVFYLAEDYHQKYYLQNTPELFRELWDYYRSHDGLTASTAAARVNGYLAGYGRAADLLKDLPFLGLSPAGQEYLKTRVRN